MYSIKKQLYLVQMLIKFFTRTARYNRRYMVDKEVKEAILSKS